METFPRYWPFVRGSHRWPVNSPHKGQWRGALMFSLICAGINGWVNNREAGDLRRHRHHYDVIVMCMWGLLLEMLLNIKMVKGSSEKTFCSDVPLVVWFLWELRHWEPILLTGLTLISVWIYCNYINYKVSLEITCLFPNFHGYTVEFGKG